MKEYGGELEAMQAVLANLRNTIFTSDNFADQGLIEPSWIMEVCIDEQLERGSIGHTELKEHLSLITALSKDCSPKVAKQIGKLYELKGKVIGVVKIPQNQE